MSLESEISTLSAKIDDLTKVMDVLIKTLAPQVMEAVNVTHTPPPPPAAEQVIDQVDTEFNEGQVRAALKEFRDIHGTDSIVAILKKHGAEGMSTLHPDKFASVMKEIS
jgi:hypothetical protein